MVCSLFGQTGKSVAIFLIQNFQSDLSVCPEMTQGPQQVCVGKHVRPFGGGTRTDTWTGGKD